MLSTQERCKCAVLEIAANGKEVVVFREVRLLALRSGGRRGCAGGVNGHPNSSKTVIVSPPIFYAFLCSAFGVKGWKYGKGKSISTYFLVTYLACLQNSTLSQPGATKRIYIWHYEIVLSEFLPVIETWP